jgi:hypothetical protein
MRVWYPRSRRNQASKSASSRMVTTVFRVGHTSLGVFPKLFIRGARVGVGRKAAVYLGIAHVAGAYSSLCLRRASLSMFCE